MGTNKTPWKIITTEVDGNTQGNSGIIGTYNPSPSDIIGTMINRNSDPAPIDLLELVLTNPMVASEDLGLVKYGNTLPQISKSMMN